MSGTSGFTLVELMVVVAMVGILSSIAIPQYSKFVAKSRQSEAKINLAAAYSALKSFYVEHGTYSVCLRQVGYVPEAPDDNCGPPRYYILGFQSSNFANLGCGPAGNQACGYTFFDGQPTGVACAYGSAAPCCSQGYVNGGGCGSPFWRMSQSDYQYPANRTYSTFPTENSLALLTTSVSQNTFRLGAIGSISSSTSSSSCLSSGGKMDTWTINQDKTLINTNSCL